jgi:hypothetical protein
MATLGSLRECRASGNSEQGYDWRVMAREPPPAVADDGLDADVPAHYGPIAAIPCAVAQVLGLTGPGPS